MWSLFFSNIKYPFILAFLVSFVLIFYPVYANRCYAATQQQDIIIISAHPSLDIPSIKNSFIEHRFRKVDLFYGTYPEIFPVYSYNDSEPGVLQLSNQLKKSKKKLHGEFDIASFLPTEFNMHSINMIATRLVIVYPKHKSNVFNKQFIKWEQAWDNYIKLHNANVLKLCVEDFYNGCNNHEALFQEIRNFYGMPQISPHIVKQEPKTKKIDEIFLISLPKSGTVYIYNKLRDSLKAEKAPLMGRGGVFPFQTLNENLLLRQIDPLSKHPSRIFVEHIPASKHNLSLINKHFEKIIVHVRDPRQALLSWVHHLNNYYKVHKDNIEVMYYAYPNPPEEYYKWDLHKQISWGIDNYLPAEVEWLQGWRHAINSNNEVKILLTKYEDFAIDNDRTIHKMIDFYGLRNVKISSITKERNVYHFRTGSVDEWKKTFTHDQILKANSKIPKDLLDFYGFEC